MFFSNTPTLRFPTNPKHFVKPGYGVTTVFACLAAVLVFAIPAPALARRHSNTVHSTRHARVKPAPKAPSTPIHLAKFEPVRGCYLGAYVESDDMLLPILKQHKWNYSREEALGEVLRKHLATAFIYWRYGDPFPSPWAKALLAAGITPHISLEPAHGLGQVQNDDYLKQFAQDAASCNGPVFLRFASEMNGDWTPWHGNPTDYKAKFRMVHQVMAQTAPNVAIIWCVNQNPEKSIRDYYPGDDYVDWVGVNFYSVLHHNNSLSRPAFEEDPSVMLEYVYKYFADRKPIAICEYGASHREALAPKVDRSDVAIRKLEQLLTSLPHKYPRVKLIDFFDCNNLEHAPAGRRLNDYCMTDSPTLLHAFRQLLGQPYFLGYSTHTRKGSEFFPADGEIRIDGEVKSVDNDQHTVTIEATRVVLPNGEDIRLWPVRNKTINYATNTLHGSDAPTDPLSPDELKPGVRMFVVGTDLGVGKSLPARQFVVQRMPWQNIWTGRLGAAAADLSPKGSCVWSARTKGAQSDR